MGMEEGNMMERSLTWRKSRLVRYAMTVVMLTVLLTVFGVRDGVKAAELPYDTIEDATGISIAEPKIELRTS